GEQFQFIRGDPDRRRKRYAASDVRAGESNSGQRALFGPAPQLLSRGLVRIDRPLSCSPMTPRLLKLLILGAFILQAQKWPTKEAHNHALARQHWFYDQRPSPSGQIPAGARRNAWLQMQRNTAAVRAQRQIARPASAQQAFSITTDSTNWTMIGP